MRPPGWEKNKPKAYWLEDSPGPRGYASGFGDGVEAGADAIFKELINQPSNSGANVLYVDELAECSTIRHDPRRKGYLVFIPEE